MGERLTLSRLSERIKEPPTLSNPPHHHHRLLCSRPRVPEQLCPTTERLLLLKNIFETFDLERSAELSPFFHFSFPLFPPVSPAGLGQGMEMFV